MNEFEAVIFKHVGIQNTTILYGCYRWLCFPFGVSVSVDIFQKILHNALYGMKGVVCIADDIVVHGKSIEEHDENFSRTT